MNSDYKLFSRAVKDLNALFASVGDAPCSIELSFLQDPSSSRLTIDPDQVAKFDDCWDRLYTRLGGAVPAQNTDLGLKSNSEFLTLTRAGISRRLIHLFLECIHLEELEVNKHVLPKSVTENPCEVNSHMRVSSVRQSHKFTSQLKAAVLTSTFTLFR